MNKRLGIAAVLLLALPMMAHASCDDVKSGIDAKIKANGVSGYTLDVVPADQADAGGKVVGQCAGNMKIVYTPSGAAASGDAPAMSKHSHAVKKADDANKSDAPAQPAPAASSGG